MTEAAQPGKVVLPLTKRPYMEDAVAPYPLPDRAYLLECLDADLDGGRLTWRTRPPNHFKSAARHTRWNTHFAGKITGWGFADSRTGEMRWAFRLDGRIYYRHRIIFFLDTGLQPAIVDHRDRDTTNDGRSNLRAATASNNQANALKNRKAPRKWPKGVHLKRGRWVAQIMVHQKRHYLGAFDTPEAAHAAYCEAAKLHFGEFWCAG